MIKIGKEISKKITRLWVGFLAFLLSLFGISTVTGCDMREDMYGPGPYELKEVTGNVKSKKDSKLIKNIFISAYDSTDNPLGQGCYTDEKGKYKLIITQREDVDIILKIFDKDGDENGSFIDRSESLKIFTNKKSYELDITLDPSI